MFRFTVPNSCNNLLWARWVPTIGNSMRISMWVTGLKYLNHHPLPARVHISKTLGLGAELSFEPRWMSQVVVPAPQARSSLSGLLTYSQFSGLLFHFCRSKFPLGVIYLQPKEFFFLSLCWGSAFVHLKVSLCHPCLWSISSLNIELCR